MVAAPRRCCEGRSERLLRSCRYHSIQDAIDPIHARHTSVYVLPGTYHEAKYACGSAATTARTLKTQSTAPLLSSEYIEDLPRPRRREGGGGERETNPIALSYADQRRCAHNLNLIALFGDRTPGDDSIRCNSRYCVARSLVGTGATSADVVVDNRFNKLNGIRADRMGGFYLSNMTFQQAEFNPSTCSRPTASVLDRAIARAATTSTASPRSPATTG